MDTLTTALNNSINSTKSNKLKQNIDGSIKSVGSFKKLINFSAIYAGMHKMWNMVSDVAKANIDMIETNNLFEVSMGKVVDEYGNLNETASQYYIKALEFQDKMNEKLATNKSELKQYQAMYYNMLISQGIDKDSSYLMSESLTKAGYDMASLYNLDVDEAMKKLQSGLAGQVKSLRDIGIDVSESALGKVLENVGIERSVEQLSYAEKEVARYIAILEQAGEAQGDFARTFESPANQIKVFKNQLEELKQVAGSFIVNVFGNILVYVNAIIMVVKEILKSFASLFGFDLNLGGSSDLSEDTGIDDVTTGLGDATKKAKELKNILMGFDEINNITLPSSSSSGSDEVSGGIDEKLLKNLKEWENQMDNISGKAQEIRDSMLDWLGFERDDDGTWKLKEGYTNFEKIKDAVIWIGLAFASWKLGEIVSNIIDFGNVISKIANGEDLTKIQDKMRIMAGLTITITSIHFLIDGLKGISNGELTTEKILKALGGSIGLGTGTWVLTKNIKLSLIVGSISVGWTIGTSIGEWLKQNYGDSIDWYIEKFNLNLNEDNVIEQAIKVAGIILGTIGDAVVDGFSNVGQWIEKEILSPIKDYFKDHPILAKMGASIWETISTSLLNAFTGGQGGIILNMIKGVTEWVKSIRDTWTEKIVPWWNEDVKPWFTKEKWLELGDNMKNSILEKWEEFEQWWSNLGIVKWWNEHVAPWFTREKWDELANNAKIGIEGKFNEWKNNFNPIGNWWNEKITPWFTREKWSELGNGALSGLKNAFSNFSFPKIKLPHFDIVYETTGIVAEAFKAMGLRGKPKLNVNWYAKGGMPETGEMFIAREAGPELVGKIGNRTTVANNQQIVDGIKMGVYEAVVNAMARGENTVRLDIRTEEGIIVKKASQGFKEYVRQTGELPFPVPV